MNIIFLDIDGVMNSGDYRDYLYSIDKTDYRMHHFTPQAIEAFNWLADQCEFDIVISSSWRYIWGIHDLRDHFSSEGIKCSDRIIDYTISSNHGQRGKEIKFWLEEHPSDNFVIIDDEVIGMGDMLEFVIKTDFQKGLQMDHVKKIAERLNEKETITEDSIKE